MSIATASSDPAPTHAETWWKGAAIYHIYLRSFKDSNNDGIGDACETSTFDNDPIAVPVPVPTMPTLWLILGAILIALQGGFRRRLR